MRDRRAAQTNQSRVRVATRNPRGNACPALEADRRTSGAGVHASDSDAIGSGAGGRLGIADVLCVGEWNACDDDDRHTFSGVSMR